MRMNKTLAKVFGPALLLTATLAMPMDTAFAKAPKEHGRAAAHAQADKHENKGKGQQHRQQAPRVEKRKQVTKRVVVQRHQPNRHQQVVRQQRVVKQKVVKQKVVRQPVVKQQVVVRQPVVRRQIVRQPVIVQQPVVRQRVLVRQPQTRVYRYDDRYYATPRRGRGGADPNVFHVDGYLDDGGDCLFLRDHEGRTWAMVGNTYGLQPGEHVRLYGTPTDGGACGYRGAAFDIYEVRTVWADQNHRRTYYDHLYDGPFDQNRAYEDDRYYNGSYDTSEDRQDRDSWWKRIFGG